MKKLLSFLALALCFVACQNEAVESVSNGDLANVVLTIDAPELGVTRADGDTNAAKNSAFGAIDFLSDADWANYDLRYILEVYDANEDGTGTPIYRERMVNCLDKYAPTIFELRLVPNREYKFVVFADFVAEGNAELTEPADKLAIADLYYNTADLRNISAITNEPTWNAMNEIRDAYFISKNVNVTTGLNETLTLTRPFAKLRVIATDLDYIAGYSAPGYVEVAYHTEKVYKSFNAVNGLLNAEEMTGDELTYGYEVSKTIPYTAGYDEFSTNQTLFADYLLAVEGEQTPVNFKMTVYEDASKARKIHEHDFTTQIPIQRNHLTTIIGDLLTTQANITIEIDDNFEDEFVIGWGDDNATKINVWNAGELNANGDYTFVVEGENNFKVTINAAAVENQKLTAGTYVLAEDAEEGEKLTFTVEALQANETTRALVDVEVIGGTMEVVANGEEYAITLDLVLQFVENKDVRHAIYTYEGPIAFGKVLETPKVEFAVKGNVITLTWNAVADATKYSITVGTEMPVFVEETTYTFTGEYETEYTFNVVAVSADEEKFAVSEAAVVTATTEAAPVVEPTYTTVAEFLAAAEDDTVYTLKGTITRVANTSYGNFDLTDETGTVYIYGLCSPEGAQKYWAESGAKLGDDIVIKTTRTSFNGDPQGKNAIFVELLPGTLAFYTVSTNAVDFTSAGGEQVINVTAYNTDAAVTATSDNSTFAVNVDGYNVTISAAANELEEEVTGNITIKVGDLAETVVKASLAAKPAAGVVEGGSSDFNTISDTNTSYVSDKTTAGWAYTNCAIFKGGTSDSSPAFKMIGDASNRALCMNGKTTAQGTITSPTITTGCGTLKFNYGLPFSDTKIKFSVDIIQNGEIVKTFTVDNSSATKLTKYSFEEAIDVAGEFQIAFKNLSPSNSTSNKDRTAIWDVEWTGMN